MGGYLDVFYFRNDHILSCEIVTAQCSGNKLVLLSTKLIGWRLVTWEEMPSGEEKTTTDQQIRERLNDPTAALAVVPHRGTKLSH